MYQGRFNGSDAQPARASRKKSGNSVGFYVFYILFVAAFVIALIVGLSSLEKWLVKFEAAQSTHKSQEIFDELFSAPDWTALYAQTNQENTAYEDAGAYSLYMQQLVGDRKLTMSQTSAGLDKSKEKYLVKLDKTIIADFTLANKAGENAQMPQWELDGLNLYFERLKSVQVALAPGNTVYINGVALDDSHIISTTTTLAEEYLPEGLHGHRLQVVRLDGLLTEPTVTIQNPNGDPLEVYYDAETGIYSQVLPVQEPSQEIIDRAVAAGQAFARYMLADLGRYGMQSYFDTNGEAYQTLPSTWELWVQDNRGVSLGEAAVSEFYQYSDSLYSIRVKVTATVTRMDYTLKDYDMDTTFLFHLTDDGRWLVDRKTNEELQTMFTQVRLRYYLDGELVTSEFVDDKSHQLTLPEITVPEGKVFLGWYSKEVDESGKTTMHLVFSPSEDGIVYIPSDTSLPSMDLYAQFQ